MTRSEGCRLREQRKRERLIAFGFWERVDKTGGPDACWPWTGSRQTAGRYGGGYGFFTVLGKARYAHRRALEATLGRQLRPGMVAMHTCDNPPCCNPAHLREGTKADNSADMAAKGRSTRAMAKLNPSDVIAIRARYAAGGVRQRDLAAEYGLTRSGIASITQGRTWPHLRDAA